MPLTLVDVLDAQRVIGRATLMEGAYWDGFPSGALTDHLTHLGDTEGAVVINPNPTRSILTVPELTGDAEHLSFEKGENPIVNIPVFYGDPALRARTSGTGLAGAGLTRPVRSAERTLMILPEELFVDASTAPATLQTLSYTNGVGWRVTPAGGSPRALTAAEIVLLGKAVTFWKGYWVKAPTTFQDDAGGKSVETLEWHTLIDSTKPDGQMLYSVGDFSATIEPDPLS